MKCFATALGFCWLTLLSATLQAADEPKFSGAFADGSTVAGGQVSQWEAFGSKPRLNGRPIFEGDAPLRWLQHESAEAGPPPRAFVEMFCGDRLPGRVVGFGQGRDEEGARQPPHVIVAPNIALESPEQPDRADETALRVKTQHIRRVVWRRRGGDVYTPSVLYYADGRQIEFRALRWNVDGVSLLLKEGTRKVSFNEIAELHLPRRSPWEVYYETLAVLSPDCTSRLMQVEVAGGLIATVSQERQSARSPSAGPQNWLHLLAPAWCLDQLWVKHTQVLWRRFFNAQQPPLTLWHPQRAVQRSTFGGWNWQLNQNAKQDSLGGGGKKSGWGLGMQAYCEVEFELPGIAQSFRSRLGLDDSVGPGGCARGVVFSNGVQSEPLYRSELLIGSEKVWETGDLALPAGTKTLTLVADTAHAGRPPGADPLDVRDLVDWFEPELRLDLEKLKAEVAAHVPASMPAWEHWRPVLSTGVALRVNSHWDARDARRLGFHRETISSGGNFSLKRKLTVSAKQNYLWVLVSRFGGESSKSKIELRVDGQLRSEFDAPERHPWGRPPAQLFYLGEFRGREVEVELVQVPSDAKATIEWHDLDILEGTTPTTWTPLEIREARSAGGATFAQEPGGTVFVSGNLPDYESYTLVADSPLTSVTAMRIEALADPRLPNRNAGRSPNGTYFLSDVRLSGVDRKADAAQNEAAVKAVWRSAVDDYPSPESQPGALIDESLQSGWPAVSHGIHEHLAILTAREPLVFPNGARLTCELDFKSQAQRSLGRFRVSVTGAPGPVRAERPGVLLPMRYVGKATEILEDRPEFFQFLGEGAGKASLETDDRFSGATCLKITGESRGSPWLPNLQAKIREKPAAGEFRYLQFAWKKPAGERLVLELCHDGKWGPPEKSQVSFRYQAGEATLWRNAALLISETPPREWTLVTRDLFADFGEFTLTGLSFVSPDGRYALFDHILLGRELDDFEP